MTTITDVQAQLNQQLARFTGTENYYQHLYGFLVTDGVMFLGDTYGTHWLISDIILENSETEIADFQVWKLKRVEHTDAFELVCEDGNYQVLKTKKIPFSDFPADYAELWLANKVLYLPSEH